MIFFFFTKNCFLNNIYLQKTHSAAVQVKQLAESLVAANHYDSTTVKEMAVEVTKRWQQLVTCAEERHKLVTASLNFYKTAEQVKFVYNLYDLFFIYIFIYCKHISN